MNTAPADILLIEDNPADAELIKAVFQQSSRPHRLRVFAQAKDALAYLRQEPPYEDRPLPNLILLDLNLPELDGRQMLLILKQDPALKRIPVVVLTGCNTPEDIQAAYRDRANGYVVKPSDAAAYQAAVAGLEKFWLNTVTLPPLKHR